jgi:hypothetical protein
MSTMTLRGPLALTKFGGFNRVYDAIRMWVEIFSDAQRLAEDAERRMTYSHS